MSENTVPYQNNGNREVPNEKPASPAMSVKTTIIALAAVVTVGIGAGVWFLSQTGTFSLVSFLSSPDKARERGLEASQNRDFNKATNQLETIVKNALNKREETRARLLYNLNQFDQTGKNSRQSALVGFKEIITDPQTTLQEKADAGNYLLRLYYRDRDPKTFETIFADEPYASFLARAQGDKKLAVRYLAEYVHELEPRSESLLRVMNWYSNELLDNKTLSSAEQQSYAATLEQFLNEVGNLYAKEQHDLWSEIAYLHWRAFHTAAVALVKPSLWNEAETLYGRIFSLYDSRGYLEPRIVQYVQYTRFYYTAFLTLHFGETRLKDVERQLETLVSTVRADSNAEKNNFVEFLKVERDTAASLRDHNYEFFKLLASSSPSFNSFLAEYNFVPR